MDLNRAMVIGNLTRDPEMRTIPSGQSVANFSIATNRHWNDTSGNKQSAVEYHNIVVWGKLAEICSQYLKKGRRVFMEGRLQTRDWEGQDGIKRSRTEIVAENMIMLDGGPARNGSYNNAGGKGAAASPENQPQQPATSYEPISEPAAEVPASSKDEEIKVEDIPF